MASWLSGRERLSVRPAEMIASVTAPPTSDPPTLRLNAKQRGYQRCNDRTHGGCPRAWRRIERRYALLEWRGLGLAAALADRDRRTGRRPGTLRPRARLRDVSGERAAQSIVAAGLRICAPDQPVGADRCTH